MATFKQVVTTAFKAIKSVKTVYTSQSNLRFAVGENKAFLTCIRKLKDYAFYPIKSEEEAAALLKEAQVLTDDTVMELRRALSISPSLKFKDVTKNVRAVAADMLNANQQKNYVKSYENSIKPLLKFIKPTSGMVFAMKNIPLSDGVVMHWYTHIGEPVPYSCAEFYFEFEAADAKSEITKYLDVGVGTVLVSVPKVEGDRIFFLKIVDRANNQAIAITLDKKRVGYVGDTMCEVVPTDKILSNARIALKISGPLS